MAEEHPFTQQIPAAGEVVPGISSIMGTDPLNDPFLELDDRQWENMVEKGTLPVAVMFYSPTCMFCHQMEPVFRNLAREYHDVILFVRLNITTNLWTAERYGVRILRPLNSSVGENPSRNWSGRYIPHS